MSNLKRRKSDNRYVKRVPLPDGKYKYAYGYTLEELQSNVDDIKAQAGLGVNVFDNSTVAEWCQKWIEGYFSKLRATTRATYINVYNAHIRPMIGAMRLKDVRQVNINAIMTSVAGQSESAQRNVLSCVRRMFNVAKDNHLIAYNPCSGIHITERSDIPDEDDALMALSDDQKAALLKAVKGLRQELFVNLGVWLGLRREESLGLQWADIDWENQVVHIRHTVTFPQNGGIFSGKLKHKASYREIPIPPPLMSLLESKNPKHTGTLVLTLHHKKDPKEETILVSQVVPDAHGGIMSKSGYDKFWKGVSDSVDFEVRSHMLRHTYCTWLYDNGIDVQTAKVLMGHSDIRITSNIYTQIGERQKLNARQKIQSIFKQELVKN